MAAAKQDGYLLQFTSERLRGDRELVFTAVKSDPISIQHTGFEQNDNGSCVCCEKLFSFVSLSQDQKVLGAAGLFCKEEENKEYSQRIAMSI